MSVCPACKSEIPDGRYCAKCGATLRDIACPRCNTPLAVGSRFCQNCGSSVVVALPPPPPPPPPPPAVILAAAPPSRIPWIIGGTATAALLILIIAQRLNIGATPPINSGTQSPPSEAPAAMRAPDISQMSPRERAARLFDRIMRLDEEGKRDSVQLFAAMAIPTFQALQPLDAHLRYDLGRVAAAAGELVLAQAQADTILQGRPQHLLGLILAAQIADRRADTLRARRLRNRLLAAEAAERGLALEEYRLHAADIDAAVSAAREKR
jgi:hypothetical protein